MWPFTLSGRVPVIAMVVRYTAIKLMGRGPLPARGNSPFPRLAPTEPGLSGITLCFHRLSPSRGCVIHALLTSPPL